MNTESQEQENQTQENVEFNFDASSFLGNESTPESTEANEPENFDQTETESNTANPVNDDNNQLKETNGQNDNGENNENANLEDNKLTNTNDNADVNNESNNSDGLSWDDINNSAENSEENREESSEDNSTQGQVPTDLSKYNESFKEYGLDFSNPEEFETKIKNVLEENSKLKESFPATNEKIDKYENILKLDDETLVRENLKAEGFKDNELTEALDKYVSSGVLDIEAKKIRNTVQTAIQNEKQAIIDSQLSEKAKLEKEAEESVQRLQGFLDKTDSLFGLKMAKTNEELKAVKDEHFKYITSGTFLNEITENEQALSEAAWLWKKRDVILKAMQTRGSNQAKKQLMDKIGRPDSGNVQRFASPEGGGEFNPDKFIANT